MRSANHAIRVAVVFALATGLLAACGDDDGPASCDLAAPSCPEGQVCLADDTPDDGGTCTDWCDPLDPSTCAAGQACEAVMGGGYGCFDPVYLAGTVFDITDQAGVEGARVIAADHTGAAVTDVVVTDANGDYELAVPVARDAHGDPVEGTFTLRVAAPDYLPYPHGLRPAIPIDGTGGVAGDGRYTVSNASTDVALIPLPPEGQGEGSIAGAVGGDLPGGTLVVAGCGAPPCPFAFADLSGGYVIYNVPAGTYTVTGYKAFLQLVPVDLTLGDGEDREGVDLDVSSTPTGSVTGSVNIVNPQLGEDTSVVLVPESVFQPLTDTFVRGEIPPGLRAPEPGVAPNISGAFTIDGVPLGTYVVLAAFENDFLVRDPDPSIAGTQILHLEVTEGTPDVDIQDSFKITGALAMVGPGAEGPEAVDASAIAFVWEDDSSEDYYTLTVWDAFGVEVWHVPDVPRVTGSSTVEVDYAGPPLEAGMYYQWRAESWRDTGPISTTEDLLGVFYVPGSVQ